MLKTLRLQRRLLSGRVLLPQAGLLSEFADFCDWDFEWLVAKDSRRFVIGNGEYQLEIFAVG